jgi:hypothetical protein
LVENFDETYTKWDDNWQLGPSLVSMGRSMGKRWEKWEKPWINGGL